MECINQFMSTNSILQIASKYFKIVTCWSLIKHYRIFDTNLISSNIRDCRFTMTYFNFHINMHTAIPIASYIYSPYLHISLALQTSVPE